MSAQAAYLLVLARISDRLRFGNYVRALPPIYARYGGRYLAVAPALSVEQFGHTETPQSVVVSRWPSFEQLSRFWSSPDYREVADLRARTGEFLVAAVDGLPDCPESPPTRYLSVILGPGPSPALLEAEGACPLALAREAQVQPLEGAWPTGDCALYGFANADVARRSLLTFSSGQRGRSLLMPAVVASQASGHSLAS